MIDQVVKFQMEDASVSLNEMNHVIRQTHEEIRTGPPIKYISEITSYSYRIFEVII